MNTTTQPENDDADRDARRPLLSEAEGQAGEIERRCNLSKFDRPIAQDGPRPKAKKKNPKLRARDKPEYKKSLRDLSASDLSLLAPRQPPPNMPVNGQIPIGDRFEITVQKRMLLYRLDALDALRDLAMMPISPNSMQNNVKYLAAARLLGNQKDEPPPSTGMDVTLKSLNDAYREQSTRIKEVRERVITFEDQAVINGG